MKFTFLYITVSSYYVVRCRL